MNGPSNFKILVDCAIREGRAVQIDLKKAPAHHFVYLQELYAAGKIDRCSDEWMGVLTFAAPEVAHR